MRLAEAEAGEFEGLGRLARGVESRFPDGDLVVDRPLYRRDGGLWVGLVGEDGAPMRRAALEAFLSAGHVTPRNDPTDFTLFFHRTPVMGTDPETGGITGVRFRGAGMEGIREIRADWSGRARADLSRFLERDVAIVEGDVRVRLRAPVLRMTRDRIDGGGPAWRAGVSLFPNPDYNPPSAGWIGDPGGFVDAMVELGTFRVFDHDVLVRPEGDDVARYLGLDPGFPFEVGRGATARLFANACHMSLNRLTVAGEAVAVHRKGGASPEGFEAALARSRDWMALGAVSAVRDEEVERCIADFRELAGMMQGMHARAANSHSIARLLRGLDRFVAPEVMPGHAAAPEEDIGTLSGLAP